MPLIRNTTNNAKSTVYTANVLATDTTFQVKPGTSTLFPAVPFRAVFERKVGQTVTLREIVDCTLVNTLTDTLTITRAVEACPMSDASTTQTQVARAFASGDFFSVILTSDMYQEVNKKLDQSGTRISMLTSQNIGATNGSPNITVANTTGWQNGLTITGTGIPPGATIVSFVANTSAVLSGNYNGVTGTVSVQVGYRQALELDATGNEIKKSITPGGSINPTSLLQYIDPTTRDRTEFPYSAIQAEMALSGSAVLPQYESTIAIGDPVAITPDGLIECTTELKSSANVTVSSITKIFSVSPLDATRSLHVYAVGVNVFARVSSRSSTDVITYGTEVNVGTGVTGPMSAGACKIDVDKCVILYADVSSGSGSFVFRRVATISGTTITLGIAATTSIPASAAAQVLYSVAKVRNNAYAWTATYGGLNFIFLDTVSGTTITTNSPIYTSGFNEGLSPLVYLTDNRIGFANSINAGNTFATIYDINPASRAISTVYFVGNALGSTGRSNFIARISDTSFACTYQGVVLTTDIYRIPPSGTTLIRSVVITNASVNTPVVSLGGGYFAMIVGTSINIYSGSTLIYTINGFSIPTVTDLFNYFEMVAGRWVYLNGTNGTSQIINFAIAFYSGLANTTSGGVLLRGAIAYTGAKTGIPFYLQSDGTISQNPTFKPIGRGTNTNILTLG